MIFDEIVSDSKFCVSFNCHSFLGQVLDMKPEQERVRLLLSDTITLLCRNGLHFSKHLRLEGVLGVTIDDTDVFIVHINELLSEQLAPPPLRVGLEDLNPYLTPSVIPLQQQLGAGIVCAESTTVGKQKRDDGDGKSTSKRHKTEVVVPAHHHHHNPNTTVTTNPQLPSPYVRCPTALLPSGKDYSDCRENIYTSVVSNNPQHDQKVLSSRKDDRINARHQDAPHHGMTPTSGAILLDQWHFNVPKRPAERPAGIATAEPQACYIQYGNEMVEGTSASTDKKTNLFPPLSVLPMQFAAGVAMAAVDYNSASTAPAPVVIGSRGAECATDGGTAQSKIWGDTSSQLQPQQNSTNERLVFDSLTGCSSWTVSQLMTNQGIMGSDEQHQSHDTSVSFIL